jgi:antirestriction protein ArdC
MATKPLFNPYKVITDTIIALLEKGVQPWRKGWTSLGGALSRPVSGGTGNPYNGINVLLLWAAQSECGYHSDTWHTYKGAQGKSGQVRKGEKGTRIVKWLFLPFKESGQVKVDAKGEPVTFAKMRLYTVFNACQIEWAEGSEHDPGPRPTIQEDTVLITGVELVKAGDQYEDAKVIIDAWADEVTITHGGDSAFYMPADDFIQLPHFDQFHSEAEYFSVAFHEAIHSTGHRTRLDRFKKERKGSYKQAYAFEELVAELGAAFLCADAGISQPEEPREDHAQYLGVWLEVLKGDPKAIVSAASKAEKAAKLVMAKAGEAEQQMAAK